MGLSEFAGGLSRTKCESPKDSGSTKPRENPGVRLTDLLADSIEQIRLDALRSRVI